MHINLIGLILTLQAFLFAQCGGVQKIQIVLNNTRDTPVKVSLTSQRFDVFQDTGKYHSLEPLIARKLVVFTNHFNMNACHQDTLDSPQKAKSSYPYFRQSSKCYDNIDIISEQTIRVTFTMFPGEKIEVFRHRNKSDGLAAVFSIDTIDFEGLESELRLSSREEIFENITDFEICSSCEIDIGDVLR